MKRTLLDERHLEAIRHIRNFISHQGKFPSARQLMQAMDYETPRSAALILAMLLEAGVVKRRPNGNLQLLEDPNETKSNARTIDVPLVGMVACGAPMLAEENIEAMIPVSIDLAKPGNKHFFLKARGSSMNAAGINDGDIILVKQQSTANEGDLVVAIVDDEATVKVFHRSGDAVILKPQSQDKTHKPIVLTRDFKIQGVVVKAIPNLY